MTLRTKPMITVSVTKKPDGRMVLSYTRPATPPSTEKCDDASSTVISTEGSGTPADTGPTTQDGASDPRGEAIVVDPLGRPT